MCSKPDFAMIPCNMKAFHEYYPLVGIAHDRFHEAKYADQLYQQLDKFVSEKQINITLCETNVKRGLLQDSHSD
jgi:hypothetical protein